MNRLDTRTDTFAQDRFPLDCMDAKRRENMPDNGVRNGRQPRSNEILVIGTPKADPIHLQLLGHSYPSHETPWDVEVIMVTDQKKFVGLEERSEATIISRVMRTGFDYPSR